MPRLTITEIAGRVGVHKSTVSRQARAWQLVGSDGKVDLAEYAARRAGDLDPSLQTTGRAAFVKTSAIGKSEALLDLAGQIMAASPSGPSYSEERAKREAAEAELAQMRVATARRELVKVQAVEQAAASVFGRAMAAFSEAWPALAPELAQLTDPGAVAERLAAEQRRVMAAVHREFMEDAIRRSAA